MTILKFGLQGEQDRSAVETDISLALFAAACVYGKTRVRLETSYALADDGGRCVLRTSGKAGRAAARIFAGLTAARIGGAALEVMQVGGEGA
jgi:hypothetical protein